MATYILSDTHFGHKKILDFERFNFKSNEEHDDFIIKKWNSVIKEKDISVNYIQVKIIEG